MAILIEDCYNAIGIQAAWAVKFDEFKSIPDLIYKNGYRFSGDFCVEMGSKTYPLKADDLMLSESVKNGRCVSTLTGNVNSLTENNTEALDEYSREQLIIMMLDNVGNMRVLGDAVRGCRLNYQSVNEGNSGSYKGQPLEANFESDHQCGWYLGNYTLTNGVLFLPAPATANIEFDEYFGETTGKYNYQIGMLSGTGSPLASGIAVLEFVNKATGTIIDTLTGNIGADISTASHTYGGFSIKDFITGSFVNNTTISIAYRAWINANSLYMSQMPEFIINFKVIEGGADSNISTAELNLPTGISGLFTTAQMGVVWGFRRIVDTYTGSLCRIRNKTTGLEADVGFGANGYLDMDAFAAIVLGNHAAVAVIYDQSGNGVNYVQTNPAKMPMIANNGTPIIDSVAGYTIGCCSFATAGLSPDGSTNHEMDAVNLSVPGTISVFATYTYIDYAGSVPSLLYNATDNSIQIGYTSGFYLGRIRGNPGLTPIVEIYRTKKTGNTHCVLFELNYNQSNTSSKLRVLPTNAGATVANSGIKQETVTSSANLNRTGNVTVTQKLFNGLFGFGNMHFHEMIMLNVSAAHLGKDNQLRDLVIEAYTL